jgi:hypothetical protein
MWRHVLASFAPRSVTAHPPPDSEFFNNIGGKRTFERMTRCSGAKKKTDPEMERALGGSIQARPPCTSTTFPLRKSAISTKVQSDRRLHHSSGGASPGPECRPKRDRVRARCRAIGAKASNA